MSRDACKTLAFVPLVALLVEFFSAFQFYFAPGWANGWPGLSMHVVWSSGMTLFVFITLMTCACSVAGILGWLVLTLWSSFRHARLLIATVLGLGFIVAGLFSWWFYQETYAETLRMWP